MQDDSYLGWLLDRQRDILKTDKEGKIVGGKLFADLAPRIWELNREACKRAAVYHGRRDRCDPHAAGRCYQRLMQGLLSVSEVMRGGVALP